MIPFHLQATDDGDYVKEEIFKKTANSILSSPIIQNSFLAKSMKKAQKATSLEMSTKSKKKKKGKKVSNKKKAQYQLVSVKKEIEHKFNVDVQAFKSEAKISYQGFINSQIRYNHANESINVSLEESLSKNSRIALTHQSDKTGYQEMVNFQMNW